MNIKESLIAVSDKLLEGFSANEVKQLLYLYIYMGDGRKDEFWSIVKDCNNRDEYQIEEIVKCVTHDIPYKPLLGTADKDMMIEVRRFMEDTGCQVGKDSGFLFIADNLLSCITDRNVLYEFRRFNKAPIPITCEQDLRLFGHIATNKASAGSGGFTSIYTEWMVLSSMYEVYVKHGFDTMMSFVKKWAEKAAPSPKGKELSYNDTIAMFAEALAM